MLVAGKKHVEPADVRMYHHISSKETRMAMVHAEENYFTNTLILPVVNGPTEVVSTEDFNKDFFVTWSPSYVNTSYDGKNRNLILDKDSGSGFASNDMFLFGQFDMQIKLIPGNSAGIVVAFYPRRLRKTLKLLVAKSEALAGRLNCSGCRGADAKTGVGRRAHGGQRNTRVASVPFLVIILGALTLGRSTASRAYQRQKETQPSYNPFLP
ncbi:probable xyloglucan endotransglucosylase/hydrolase protein 10 [Phtheirospermum japonicum]|uniref:Probable xyloglucan endotransglucosylase/hydrolase protein 10 n=1 Tax=Phtheirospermum japonicum TaxID=374723 RepID=A0A830BVQ4_9LAMI|nr:probable xyloglucan endotransglucosylase/hydrolase protein 10 [Phtheirospermum japonicum]